MENNINALFDKPIASFSPNDKTMVDRIIQSLDQGEIRSAYKQDNEWLVNEWVKKAILLYFKLQSNFLLSDAPNKAYWFDKITNKFTDWQHQDFHQAQLRCVPPAFIRYGSYVGPKVIIMPSFINIGAYVDEGTMIDSWATVGSCAQIGKNCHISANVCIGGVLEPIQANPVIIEDNCFIGAGSQILEGVLVEEGAVVAAGTVISGSTKIVNRSTGEISYGKIPKGAVVIPGSINVNNNLSLNCAVITKQVDLATKNKTSINNLLRD